jgi:transposase
VAGRGKTAADLGAWICFEDEAGQGLRPPRATTWGQRGHTPVIRVRGGGTGHASIAGLACYRPGRRSRLIYRLRAWRGRAGERKSFTWDDYRALITAAHTQLGAPIVLIWDNLNRHTCAEMRQFIAASTGWLAVFQLPPYAPELNPVEGIWSLLKRGELANLTITSLDHLLHVIRRSLKRIQYRPHLIDGCLTGTGLFLHRM